MNKYYQTLDKILQTGKIQTNRKGRIKVSIKRKAHADPPLIYLTYLKATG